MTSIAAGLAMNGKIAFMTSTAIFSPSRNWDQIRMSICMNNANVKIIGSHQGFSNGPDGGVAQPFEDIALLKVLPNMKIISPIDAEQTKRAVEYAIKTEGPVYIRTSKEPSVEITSATTPFEEGRPLKLWDGRDITLVSHGPITFEVLLAARELLARYKINAEVLSYGFIKPLDREALLEFAAKTKRVLVVEEHQISGGLGSTICEVLSEFLPTKVVRMGMEDMFSQSGSYVELLDKYKLSSHHIVERVKEFLK
jgi:transketolase